MTNAERELLGTTARILCTLLEVFERPPAFGEVIDRMEARGMREEVQQGLSKLMGDDSG